ncbi:hypothetical protein SKAU_G00352010 [Synaphobranchus kaupii]|uniref:Uncharacterized protein n=1 Tax=Synaphobranchus kaupii TaxID=118154 RepID=A0A9Q1EKP4_SYNKA|nr:hypothetical protein SKAU_G00352010 [Synaphobranchus kaupii]
MGGERLKAHLLVPFLAPPPSAPTFCANSGFQWNVLNSSGALPNPEDDVIGSPDYWRQICTPSLPHYSPCIYRQSAGRGFSEP